MKGIGASSPASSTQSFTPSLVVIIDISKTLSELRGHRPSASDHGAAGRDAAVNRHHRAGDVSGLRPGQKPHEAPHSPPYRPPPPRIFVQNPLPPPPPPS